MVLEIVKLAIFVTDACVWKYCLCHQEVWFVSSVSFAK